MKRRSTMTLGRSTGRNFGAWSKEMVVVMKNAFRPVKMLMIKVAGCERLRLPLQKNKVAKCNPKNEPHNLVLCQKIGLFTKFLFDRRMACITNMRAAFMLRMQKSLFKMRAMSIVAARKA